MIARKLNYSTKCLLFGTRRTFFGEMTPGMADNWVRNESAQEAQVSQSARENLEDRRTSQVASSRRSIARAIRMIVSAIVYEPSNKTASSKPQPTISCHGYPETWQYFRISHNIWEIFHTGPGVSHKHCYDHHHFVQLFPLSTVFALNVTYLQH
jgi:hypothetical protein